MLLALILLSGMVALGLLQISKSAVQEHDVDVDADEHSPEIKI